MKILILGITGMLGNTIFRYLSQDKALKVYGTIRGSKTPANINIGDKSLICTNVDVENHDKLVQNFLEVRPDIVINCVGLIKQLSSANDPLQAIPINSLLPHRLAGLSAMISARLIHISTDCVFSGKKGNYLESDFADAYDLYGRSKLLGEVSYPHTVTLRTSIIGHELAGTNSLINWFLSQSGVVKGFNKAIYTGFPTVELAKIIHDYVIPNLELNGLYHVASLPINKYKLLNIVAKIYNKNIEIIPSEELVIDRSLNAERFNAASGYTPPAWEELIRKMYEFK